MTWTAPSSERTITKYELQYGIRNTVWFNKDLTSRSTTLEGLSAGAIYDIRVRAVSDVGAGQYSQKSTVTTYRGMNSIAIIYILLIIIYDHLIQTLFLSAMVVPINIIHM